VNASLEEEGRDAVKAVDEGRKDQDQGVNEGKKEAVKTYVEQTKLLVALASAFLVAPPALVALLKGGSVVLLTPAKVLWLIGAEIAFIISVISGYIVLASIAGWQNLGRFDVNRPATKWWSIIQFFTYLPGLLAFLGVAMALIS
jgi:hypothetical protein